MDDRDQRGGYEENDFLPDRVRRDEPRQYDRDEITHRPGRGRRIARLFLWLLLTAGVLFVLNATLFRVRTVDLEGLRTIPKEEVANQADLKRSMSWLFPDVNGIRTRIERNPYLEFLSVTRHFPGRLVIHLKERAPCANVRGGGAFYVVDEKCNVLSTINATYTNNGLPDVVGIAVRSANAGMRITAEREDRIDMYEQIIEEMLLQGVVNLFSGIDLSDGQHIYLTTFSGYTADIGQCKELRAKLGTLRAVMNWLMENSRGGGMIDVSIPGQAVYSPQ